MGINIRTNISSMNTQRYLNSSTDALSASYSRLSSGLRIVKASDDAAGLSIAEQLKADSKIATVAIRNANDGVSAISIINGAVDEMTSTLTRLAELAEQSANGVYSLEQRSALESEYKNLADELQRIVNTTQFNGLDLLDHQGNLDFQVGYDGQIDSRITLSGIQVGLIKLGLAEVDGSGYKLKYSLTDSSSTEVAQSNSRSALDAFKSAINIMTGLRGQIGSAESRLNVAISNLAVSKENFTAAESRIRDVDVAAESAELSRLSILQQAAAAMLTQANQQPAMALQLLKQ
ncbi:MAG: flagellin FliC [Deltaproteobacteria bacterium]|jgi:flagellin|nr:flagellin FliC [Deltaproteobacteria bacterium]